MILQNITEISSRILFCLFIYNILARCNTENRLKFWRWKMNNFQLAWFIETYSPSKAHQNPFFDLKLQTHIFVYKEDVFSYFCAPSNLPCAFHINPDQRKGTHGYCGRLFKLHHSSTFHCGQVILHVNVRTIRLIFDFRTLFRPK